MDRDISAWLSAYHEVHRGDAEVYARNEIVLARRRRAFQEMIEEAREQGII